VETAPLLGTLDAAQVSRALNHPEQRLNVGVIANLIDHMDRAGHHPADLYNFQVALFRCSYRAQQAAADISRALKRLADGKGPDWQGQHGSDLLQYLVPLWTPMCPIDSRNPEDWHREAVVAARVVRQLRDVGDGLAWRVHHFDRRLIIALSDHAPAGPIVPKKGLDSEVGRIIEVFRDTGHFALMHDLTTVLRHHDLTEVHANGYRELHEVKATVTRSSIRAASKQRRALEAAFGAAAGRLPLESSGAHISRSHVQLRTHIRELSAVLTVAQRHGYVSSRVGDRIVGAVHFPTIAASGEDLRDVWDAYQARRAAASYRWMPGASNVLQNRMTFTESRNPFYAPFSIFPLPVAQRTALVCDLVYVESIMDADVLAASFKKIGIPTQTLLDHTGKSGHDVMEIVSGDTKMTVHTSAVSHLLSEFVRTDCFVKAFAADISSATSGQFVLTFSNEKAAWR
jgi:hypothetical protein